MPRRATSDSEEEVISVKEKQISEDDPDVVEDIEEDEQEFEIEAIIKASLSIFPEGKLGYYVKWKDFGEDDNSWVSEEDAEGARDLIAEFWKKHPNKKMREKSAIGRQVAAASASAPASASASASASKRRPRATAKYETDGEEEEEEEPKSKKRPRKSNGSAVPAKKSKTRTPSPESIEPEEFFQPTAEKKYKDLASWEKLVTRIDTVERGNNDDHLYVYFQIRNHQSPCVERSDVAAQKFPQKLIHFYETNLRWKLTEEAEAEE